MNSIIRSTYFTQIGAVISGILAGALIPRTIHQGNYWLTAINSILIPINIWTFITSIKTRKRMRNGFTKTAQCSCGACDWGTLQRQYDEVPVCRNCWTTWKGK